jgi:hypothetical protein
LTRTPALNLNPAKLAYPLLIALTFALALFLRLTDLSNPPLDFHSTRQYFGAIRARAIYQQTAPNIPEWQRDLSARFLAREAQLEPLILENISAYLYQWTGETPAVARALSGVFWLLGGIFLYRLARNLTDSRPAAYAALLFYLFLPYSIVASRAFQPDPLMMLFLLAFWWAFEHWTRQPADWRWTILSGLLGGLAIYVKLTAFFFVAGGALGLLLPRLGLLPTLKRSQTWLLVGLGILPGGLYVYDGLWGCGFLSGEFGGRTLVNLWFNPYFYLRWFDKLDSSLPFFFLALAILGTFVFANKTTRWFLLSLWLFYIIFGLAQTHHIASHDYYSLPTLPIAALGLAPIAAVLLDQILQRTPGLKLRAALFALLVTFLLTTTAQSYLEIRTSDNRPVAQAYAEIGQILKRQPGIVAITGGYGYPLFYHGWQNVNLWESVSDFEQDFARQTYQKAYFLVTDFEELARQPELAKKLENYAIVAQTYQYIIYDLKAPQP